MRKVRRSPPGSSRRMRRLGEYQIYLARKGGEGPMEFSGSFRVEEYRVPLMRAVLRAPVEPQVSPASIPLDVTVTYLSGGGAGNLPVRLRYDIQPSFGPSFDDFDDFVFSNGRVKEGLFRGYGEAEPTARFEMKTVDLTLDRQGSVRTAITDLPKVEKPMAVAAELEFRDPNGEAQTVASRIPLWPAQWNVGLRPDSWTLSKDLLKFQVAVVDLIWKTGSRGPCQSRPVSAETLLPQETTGWRLLCLRKRIRGQEARDDLRRENGRARAPDLRKAINRFRQSHSAGGGPGPGRTPGIGIPRRVGCRIGGLVVRGRGRRSHGCSA